MLSIEPQPLDHHNPTGMVLSNTGYITQKQPVSQDSQDSVLWSNNSYQSKMVKRPCIIGPALLTDWKNSVTLNGHKLLKECPRH